MSPRKKKKEETPEEAPPAGTSWADPTPILHMLEAIRLAILAGNAGSGTKDEVDLRVASNVLAEKAFRSTPCLTAESN